MSYQVLARKYRPKSFSEVVGQQHVLASLTNALDKNRLHHAYLFSGTRGVGKTSLARLLTKSINCLQGVSSNPCNRCEHCIAIEQGRFVDFIEIDAASRTKVEDTREILDQIPYMPTQGKYKVYLIDEAHMLSQHSFNALLKTLEEPPDHVKFFLATTDLQKLPITILSRCLQFHLKHLSEIQIEYKLSEILTKEEIKFEKNALKVISYSANGSMRDALTLTEQLITYGTGNIVTKDVQSILGIIDENMMDKLIFNILEENTKEIIVLSEKIILEGKSSESVLNALAECFYYASLLSFNYNHLSSNIPCSIKTLQAMEKNYAKDTLQLYYQLTLKAKEDIHLAPNAQCGLGMALLRLCAFSFVDNTLVVQQQHNKKNNSNKTINQNNTITASTTNNLTNWQQLSQNLELKGTSLQIAVNSTLVEETESLYILNASDTIRSLITENGINKIEEALSKKQGRKIQVSFSHLTDLNKNIDQAKTNQKKDDSYNRITKIYDYLKENPNIKKLKSLGFDLKKDNIKLKKI